MVTLQSNYEVNDSSAQHRMYQQMTISQRDNCSLSMTHPSTF